MRRFRTDQRGGVAIMSVLLMALMLLFTGLAVDIGSIYLDSRKLQGAADLAALAAASAEDPQAAAEKAAAMNFPDAPVAAEVTAGRYSPDSSLTPAARFQASSDPVNAVKVTLTSQTPLLLAGGLLGKDGYRIRRTATAANANMVSFSVGSRLAALRGGVVNALLGALTGSEVELEVADYEALADADVTLLRYFDALRTRLGAQALSFDDLLNAEIAAPDALGALGDALDASGAGRAGRAVSDIALELDGEVTLGALIGAGPMGGLGRGGSSAPSVNAQGLLTGLLLQMAGGKQVELDLDVDSALVNASVRLAVGERMQDSPWIRTGARGGESISTAQIRMDLDVEIGQVGGILGKVVHVRLPLALELAQAEAKLISLDCSAGSSSAVVMQVTPAVGTLYIGEASRGDLTDFGRPFSPHPGELLRLLLVRVDAYSELALGGDETHTVRFSRAEAEARTVKTVATEDIAEALVGSLIEEMELEVHGGLLGLAISPDKLLGGPLTEALTDVAGALDEVLVEITALAGVSLGEADVRVNGLRCGAPVLVL